MLRLECRDRQNVMQCIFPSFFRRFIKEDVDSNQEDSMRGQFAANRIRRFPTIAVAIVVFVAVFVALVGDVEERYIFTFAGTGEPGFGGDGGAATEAQFNGPFGLAADGSGNLYVADIFNHVIRRIDPEGVITTMAGTGEPGFGGDGGPATEAELNHPRGVAVDGAGNVYVTDIGNNRIRRIDLEGVITTIAGTGERGFDGDGGAATEAELNGPAGVTVDATGNVYLIDYGNNRIRRIDPEGIITTIAGTGERGFGGDGGPATEAQFNRPIGLALDGMNNVYVGDQGNHRVRRINPNGVITTIAGTGDQGFGGDGGLATEAQLSWPSSVAVDGADNLYVVGLGNCRIRRIDPDGVITTFAGSGPAGAGCGHGGDGGPATEAQLKQAVAVTVDEVGNVYLADLNQIRIIRLPGERNPVTQEFPQFANGDSTASDLVLVNVDTKTVTPVVRFFGSMGDPISAESVVDLAEDLELAADGALTVTAGIPPLGERTISTHGQGALTTGSVRVVSDGYIGGILRFESMAVGVAGVGAAHPVNDAMFPARRQEGGINTGAAVRNLASEAMMMTCHLMQGGEVLETAMVELAADGQQARFINEMFPDADTSDFTGSVRCATPEGKKFIGVALEMDTRNHTFTTLPVVAVLATSRGGVEVPRIFPIAGTGEVGDGGDGGPATGAQLYQPTGLAVDGGGNVYVVDRDNHGIRRIDPEGIITTIAGTGENEFGGDGGPATEARLSFPNAVMVDGIGNIFVTDGVNSRIRRIDAEGIITTIAGTGEQGFGGDGGPAIEAQLNRPHTMVLDGAGNLYVTDRDDFRIRRIDAEGIITTIAGTGERGFAGDGGPATEAQFNHLYGLALDGAGNLYVADRYNRRVRRIDPEGIITTIAGTGEWGNAGDGGPATEAQLSSPYSVAVDKAGNLYVGEDCRVRRIDPEGIITTIAGSSNCGYGGDGGSATDANLSSVHGMAMDDAGNLYVADRFNHRIRVIRPAGERNPVTQEFPHFANGDSTLSDLVLVNVDTKTVTPVVRFFDSKGDPISADSVVDLTDDLELASNGALSVKAGIKPLGERTISTHGREALTSGSVRVVSDGYVGGVLRFDSMAVGVAGVAAAEPLNDALFPARREEGGINTGAAVRNLASEAVTLTCHLMQSGNVLETAMVELAGNGQQARFINEMFPDTDTSAFTGSVRCTAPEGKKFTGVALEMDIGSRIFTTLPLVPVRR